MKQIKPKELDNKIKTNEKIMIIDVRENHERDIVKITDNHFTMASILNNELDISKEIPKDIKIVIHCKSGKRSMGIISFLENNFGYENLYNLEGGIIAWIDEVNNSLNKY